jgi:hypothetical protein
MAKAVIPSKDFNKLYKVFRKKKVEEKIMEVFLNAMDS